MLHPFFYSCGYLALLFIWTKIGEKLQTPGQSVENDVLMFFSFWTAQCYHSIAKTSIPAAQHSVGCDPNQKHSGKLNLTTRQKSSLPPPYQSYHKPVFLL